MASGSWLKSGWAGTSTMSRPVHPGHARVEREHRAAAGRPASPASRKHRPSVCVISFDPRPTITDPAGSPSRASMRADEPVRAVVGVPVPGRRGERVERGPLDVRRAGRTGSRSGPPWRRRRASSARGRPARRGSRGGRGGWGQAIECGAGVSVRKCGVSSESERRSRRDGCAAPSRLRPSERGPAERVGVEPLRLGEPARWPRRTARGGPTSSGRPTGGAGTRHTPGPTRTGPSRRSAGRGWDRRSSRRRARASRCPRKTAPA